MISSTAVKTYNSRQVYVAFGREVVTGVADDSFITIAPKGNGVVSKSGCDGEVARAIDPNEQYQIQIVLLQTSDWNQKLQDNFIKDLQYGNSTFPVEIKDGRGELVFEAVAAWVSRPAQRQFGKDTQNIQWTLETSAATLYISNYSDRGAYADNLSIYK